MFRKLMRKYINKEEKEEGGDEWRWMSEPTEIGGKFADTLRLLT